MIKDWIAVDWGTSNLRIWRLNSQGEILDEARSDEGMGALAPQDFEPVLLKHVENWLEEQTLVLACGMVGARQGWYEADYIATPCAVLPSLVKVPTRDQRLDVRIAAGVKQMEPAEVMRGEETQIAGFLADKPDFEGAIALPGTHSKWTVIEGGQITRFRTVMTGESFAFYSKQSVLRFSMGHWDEAVFLDAAMTSFADPACAHASYFNIRARDLLNGDQTGEARLSGLLIGMELASTRDLWDGQEIAIVGAGALAKNYAQVLQNLGANATVYEGQDMTLRGLKNIKKSIEGALS